MTDSRRVSTTPNRSPPLDALGPMVHRWVTEAMDRLSTIWADTWSSAEQGRREARSAREAPMPPGDQRTWQEVNRLETDTWFARP